MKLNAANRLQSQTELTAAPLTPERIKTYMSSLYTQLLKVLRQAGNVDKKDIKLTKNDEGQRVIFVADSQAKAVLGALTDLGWTKTKKGPKPYTYKHRADGTWPLVWWPIKGKGGFGLTMAPADHIDG